MFGFTKKALGGFEVLLEYQPLVLAIEGLSKGMQLHYRCAMVRKEARESGQQVPYEPEHQIGDTLVWIIGEARDSKSEMSKKLGLADRMMLNSMANTLHKTMMPEAKE